MASPSPPALADNLADLEVIFVHIPKTAGTTLRQFFYQMYGKKRVYLFDRSAVKGGPRQLHRSVPPGTRVLLGHFTFREIEHLYDPERHRIVSFIRDPLARYISTFFHLQRIAEFPDATLRERIRKYKPFWLYAIDPRHSNVIHHYLSGLPPDQWDFIGRQECFEQDLIHLQSVLGLDPDAVNRMISRNIRNNINERFPPESRQVPDRLLAWIDFVNRKDLALVRRIRAVRRRKGWEAGE